MNNLISGCTPQAGLWVLTGEVTVRVPVLRGPAGTGQCRCALRCGLCWAGCQGAPGSTGGSTDPHSRARTPRQVFGMGYFAGNDVSCSPGSACSGSASLCHRTQSSPSRFCGQYLRRKLKIVQTRSHVCLQHHLCVLCSIRPCKP